MNKWRYYINGKKENTSVKMGAGKTIESVFKSLKKGEKLIRIEKGNEEKTQYLVSVEPNREWIDLVD